MTAFHVPTDGKPVRVVLQRRAPDGPWWFSFWRGNRKIFRSSKLFQERDARAAARDAVLSEDAGRGASGGIELDVLIGAYLDTRWPEFTGTHDRKHPRLLGRHVNRTYDDIRLRLFGFSRWVHKSGPGPAGGSEWCILVLSSVAVAQLVQRFIDFRRKTCKPVTVHNDVQALSRFFVFLRKRHASWDQNPATRGLLELPAVEPVVRQDVTEEDLQRLLDAARTNPLWPVLLLCLGAGLRPRGACGALRRDLALMSLPSVRVTEKRRQRTIALPGWVAEELRAWLPEGLPAEAKLWPGIVNDAHNELRRVRQRMDPPLGEHVTLQALRRVHSTLCYGSGMLPQEESRRLGHSVHIADKRYVQWKELRESGALSVLSESLRKIAAKPEQKPEHEAQA